MISLVVVSLNEGSKLKKCLASVKNFAQELVVIDLESTDQTAEIAREFKAKVFKHSVVPYVEPIRNFAISKTQGDWVLILDPDEQISPSLAIKLKEISQENKFSAVNIPRKNIFFGHWILHTNFWPDRHIRFFKKGAVDWPKRIHAYAKVSGSVLELPAKEEWAILHYGYDNYQQVINRQRHYSTIEAQNRLENGENFSLLLLVWMPMREFLTRFIKHLGFLDGVDGLFLVLMLMYYQILVQLKLLKLQKSSP